MSPRLSSILCLFALGLSGVLGEDNSQLGFGLDPKVINKYAMQIFCGDENSEPTKCECLDGSNVDIPTGTFNLMSFQCNNLPPKQCTCSNGKTFGAPSSQDELSNLMARIQKIFKAQMSGDKDSSGAGMWTLTGATIFGVCLARIFI